MTLREAYQDYMAERYRLSPHTKRTTRQRLSIFVAWCEAHDVTLSILSQKHVHAFLVSLEGREMSTVRAYGDVVKAFLHWIAEQEDYDLSASIPARIKLPKPLTQVIEVFSPEQISALLKACEQSPLKVRNKAIVSVMVDCGLRAGEVVGLLLPNVWLDPEDMRLLITGKGRRQREVGFGHSTRIVLRRYVTRFRKPRDRDEQHLFLSYKGTPLTTNGLRTMVSSLGELAHVEDVHPHRFRHSFACMSLLNGTDIYKLSRLMGHSSVKVTEHYLSAIKAKQARQGISVLDHLMEDL